MKLSKIKLKEIIKEEIESDPALIQAIEKLSGNIERLDVSIDYLSAAFTGGNPLSISHAQKQIGRAYRPSISISQRASQRAVGEQKTRLKELIKKELKEMYADHSLPSLKPVAQSLSSAGIAKEPESVRRELMRLVSDLDPRNQEEVQELADLVASLLGASSENVSGNYGLEEKKRAE